MSPDKIAIIIAVVFIVLFISHYIALKVGWNMGIKTNPNILLSNPKKSRAEHYEEKPDEFDEQRLDYS